MTTETKNETAPEPKKGESNKANKVVSAGRHKMSEEDVKRMGLDPACYGYVKK